MGRKGFIATSLLYSFFLIFCALLIALVTSFLHNRMLITNVTRGIRNELAVAGNRTVSSLSVGDYVRLSLSSNINIYNQPNVLWVVAENSGGNSIKLVSAEGVYNTFNHQSVSDMQDELDNHYNIFMTGGTANSNHITYLRRSNLNTFNSNSNETIRRALMSTSDYLYYEDVTSPYRFRERKQCDPLVPGNCNQFNYALKTSGSIGQYSVRPYITVHKDTPIQSGKGEFYDPCILANYVADSFILNYHYLNNTSNKGQRTSGFNQIVDLSGNIGPTTGKHTINSARGFETTGTTRFTTPLYMTTFSNNYTLEFRSRGTFILSSSNLLIILPPTQFLRYDLSGSTVTLNVSGTTYTFNQNVKADNTITLTRNGSTRDLYLNGKRVGTFPNISGSTLSRLVIGSGTNVTKNFKSLRIYDRALTPSEVLNNYNVDLRWGG